MPDVFPESPTNGIAAPLKDLLKTGFHSGLHKGWSGFVWMAKILIPISFLTALLAWSGWINKADVILRPVMGFLDLPATAALPLLIGMLANIYGGIAAMVVLPFTQDQMTLMAIFLLMCHSLIQEGVIQGKSGLSPVKATVLRLTAATITVLCVAPFLNSTNTIASFSPKALPIAQPFMSMLKDWGMTTFSITVKMFVIIMSLLILLEVMKALGWIKHVVRALSPLLKALGLSEKVGFIWVTAAVFGLSYGAAVIVEEAKGGHLTKEELEGLQISIGMNHSLVEDPALFLSLGLSAFWLWVPRLVMAMVAVRLLTLWQAFRTRG
jgi:spore maturation protein SpmB